MASSLTSLLSRWRGSSSTPAATGPTKPRPPGPIKSVWCILYRLHHVKPLGVDHEVPQTLLQDLTARLKFSLHVSQRTARILGTLLLRACVRHPLGWDIPQEVLAMLIYGILQSRQVPAWRAFFAGVGDLQAWVPVSREQVTTGSCSSWWIRLPAESHPQQPRAKINWLFLHGGAFVAGDALMYCGVYCYWMKYLAKQGIDCSILSVEYPLAPEHPFPAGVNAAADAIHWLLHDSGETADYFVGGDSAGGNLAIAGLTLLRDAGKLSRPPLGITLISPALDMSNASVFGSREPVSSHFDHQQQHQLQDNGHQQQRHSHSGRQHQHHSSSGGGRGSSGGGRNSGGGGERQAAAVPASQQGGGAADGHPAPGSDSSSSSLSRQPTGTQQQQQEEEQANAQPSPAPSVAQLLLGGSFRRRRTQQQQQHSQQHPQQQQGGGAPPLLESQGSFNVAQKQLEEQHVPLQQQPSIDCKMHAAHTAGGPLRPRRLLRGLLGEARTALRVHTSSSDARQGAAAGWFDYIPADSFADELHCYLQDPQLLSHPLVSPTYLRDFTGLCQAGMLVVAGGAELMRPDIQAFAAKAAKAAAAASTAAQPMAAAAAAPQAPSAAALRVSEASDAVEGCSTAAQADAAAGAAAGAVGGCGSSGSNGGSSGGRGSSFQVVYHEEPNELHVFPMLTLPHLLKKGLVVPRFVAAVVKGEPLPAGQSAVGHSHQH